MEGGGKAVIGFLESDDPESTNVIYTVEFGRGTSSESSTSDPNLAHFPDDMGEDVLDRSERGTREFQRPLNLESVRSRELSEDDHSADLARRVSSVEVFSMNFVIPWPDGGQMNLGTLPTTFPILNSLIDLLLDLGVHQAFDIGKLNTALFSTVDLLPQVPVALLGISLRGVDPLLGDGSERAPPKIVGKNPLCVGIDTTPDRLQSFV